MIRSTSFRAVFPLGALAFVAACQGLSHQADCTEDPGICDPNVTDGGTTDGGPIVPPGCDLAKSPKDAAECIDDGVGIFVSPAGDDAAAGSKSLPVKSIAKGLELASARGLPRVYVCEGTYDANVEIQSPVSIYGGLACTWTYSGVKPKVAPPKGVALRVTKVSGAVAIEDMEIAGSADPNTPGDSAIAVFVSESTDVTFRSDVLTAGAGTAGAKGTESSNWTGTATTGTATASGGNAVTCTCLDGTTSSTGGRGGAIAAGGDPGTAIPSVGDLNGGGGGNTCLPGGTGANGLASMMATGSTTAGTLSSAGWTSDGAGGSGGKGNPGQGGGGGGGKTGVAGGGGGGCGGCGGGGGAAGLNGGSSLALLSFNATITVSGGTLMTSPGAIGGTGGSGQAGQEGALGGPGACDGGPGGHGAGGSGGGGGAGGHSVPIAFVGTEPRVSGATLTPGAAGAGGEGGQAGAGPGNPGAGGAKGADGKSQNTLAL